MRKLEEHFCTYEQTQKLMSLGLICIEHLKHITPSNEILYQLSESCLGAILRSQALDLFRDKGYRLEQRKTIDDKYYFYIYNTERSIAESTYMNFDYILVEHELISRLIELEMEAQNGESTK